MANHPAPGAVLFAKDPARLGHFYSVLLSMQVTHAGADLMVLEWPAYQLVIHGIPKKIAKGITITSPPARRVDTAVKLFFPVDSLAETRSKAAALGGELDPQKQEFEARGFRACDGHDPEGNVVQFRGLAG